MASTISILAALPLQVDELRKGGKLLLSTTPPPSPPTTPTSIPSTTHTPTAHPISASSFCRDKKKTRRPSCTTNRAPFRRHSTCTLAPGLLACCGDNMRGGLSAPGGGRDSDIVSRAGTPLPRFLGEFRLIQYCPARKTLTGQSTDNSGNVVSPAGGERQDATPTLLHRVNHTRSILSLAVSTNYIYAGSQTGEILVWSIETFQRVATVKGHQGSVLSLFLCEDQSLLFSSAGDAIINVGLIPTGGCLHPTDRTMQHRSGTRKHSKTSTLFTARSTSATSFALLTPLPSRQPTSAPKTPPSNGTTSRPKTRARVPDSLHTPRTAVIPSLIPRVLAAAPPCRSSPRTQTPACLRSTRVISSSTPTTVMCTAWCSSRCHPRARWDTRGRRCC